MRQELKYAYENLFLNYISSPRRFFRHKYIKRNIAEEYDVIDIIRKELQIVDDLYSNEVEVRPDAKLFVLIIYHQMVAIPLLNEERNVNVDLLKGNIKKDIKDLFDSAYEQKRYEKENEISAHTILSLLDSLWGKLNIAKNEWWNS